MKKSIIAVTIAASVIAAPAFADKFNYGTRGSSVVGQVVQVVPDTREVAVQVPDQRCELVDVPIYGNSQSFDQDSAIIGGIVGGILGNQIGNGSGREAATGVGALAGAIIGGKKQNQNVVGYRQEKYCTTEYTTRYEERVYGYDVVVEVEDTVISFRSNSGQYKVGDKVNIQKSYSVK